MATQLRDIPGASKRRPGRRRQRDSWDGITAQPRPILFDPRASLGGTAIGNRRRSGLVGFRRRRRLSGFDTLLVLAVIAVGLFLAKGLWSATRVQLSSQGLDRHADLTYEAAGKLDVHISFEPKSGMASSSLLFDGRPVPDTEAERLDDGYRWTPGQLLAGHHELSLSVPRPILPASRFVWSIDVDTVPPAIETDRLLPEHRMDEPVHLAGKVTQPEGVTMTANGEPVELDDEGRFTVDYDRPPAGPIVLKTEDEAGYKVTREVFVPIRRPSVKGVHMSAISWRTKDLRQGVFKLIDEGKINTVELDLKDESGEVGYHSKVPLAQQIKSDKGYYDLHDAVKELHDRGVRVIGRIVVFRDPILARAAWDGGHKDWVVQAPDGSPHGSYGGLAFTNMASKAVQQYNLDIASEAAGAGVDEILYDYIRRPEGDLSQIVFPGMPSDDDAVKSGVATFLTRSHELLRAKGVYQGASLFGIAAGDPAAVGQNVPLIARHVDYISPMVYPSLWTDQQYKVTNPALNPFTIVKRSLEDFRAKAEGTGVHWTPWLQDFSLDGIAYGDTQVHQQIRGAQESDMDDFLLWSPRVKYHAGQLATDAQD
jgi:hypothetical protein